MTNTFFHDIPDDDDTQADDDDTQPITVLMINEDGIPLGVVMVGSIAHRALLASGFYEVTEEQS